MTSINLPVYKTRLLEVSKELFLEHGWRLPDSLRDRENGYPRNFTPDKWQQANRLGKDAQDIKRNFQEAWAVSDTKESFAHAVPKFTRLKTKHFREKLGDAKDLHSVDEVSEHIAQC